MQLSKSACVNAVCVPSVLASVPSPVAFAPPDPVLVMLDVSHTGAPANSRAVEELPATLALLSKSAFSISSFCSLAHQLMSSSLSTLSVFQRSVGLYLHLRLTR